MVYENPYITWPELRWTQRTLCILCGDGPQDRSRHIDSVLGLRHRSRPAARQAGRVTVVRWSLILPSCDLILVDEIGVSISVKSLEEVCHGIRQFHRHEKIPVISMRGRGPSD